MLLSISLTLFSLASVLAPAIASPLPSSSISKSVPEGDPSLSPQIKFTDVTTDPASAEYFSKQGASLNPHLASRQFDNSKFICWMYYCVHEDFVFCFRTTANDGHCKNLNIPWNNKITAYSHNPTFRCRWYDKTDCKGEYITTKDWSRNIGPYWNDRWSSYRCDYNGV